MTDLAFERRRGRATVALWSLIACGVVAVLAANAHLLYVASSSQPACVDHLRQNEAGSEPGLYRAANSSCSPSARRPPAQGNER
ncbi:hypothetical protein H8A95_16375 [Bradyrhizobium sp. Pear76]|uniref:hypothetical protein n=1 Tax=Bradyrhizobium oropedii TaxID=1571201 RepID=UPI001E30FC14|nr:hypothetical protein [Bradyrhizobium oropedii]MCC8963845.1 hypothetical protein [Bradyrhizobium oropedii]